MEKRESTVRLGVVGVSVEYESGGGRATRALDDVSMVVERGRRVAIVGESGSGKSTLGLALLGLLPPNAAVTAGSISVSGTEVSTATTAALRGLRGRHIGMVFQDAKTAFDPLRTVGYQIAQPLLAHRMATRAEAAARARELLEACEIPRAAAVARQYPHELSGGMRQRAMIASALAGKPSFLVADEPTSALDVTTQAAVLELLRGLSASDETGTILITHDLGVVANFADDVVVLYAGVVVEAGSRETVMNSPAHPYTAMLLAAMPSLRGPKLQRMPSIPGSLPNLAAPITGCRFEPRCPVGKGDPRCRGERPAPTPVGDGTTVACHYPNSFSPAEAAASAIASTSSVPAETSGAGKVDRAAKAGLPADAPIISGTGISKTFTRRSLALGTTVVRAVRDVDLTIERGETIAIVGESGSGKTTLARILVGLEQADAGDVSFAGRVIAEGGRKRRRSGLPPGLAQMVFQDPGDSLDPFQSLLQIISEPLVVLQGGRPGRYERRVRDLLADVGLDPDWLTRRPAQLSGGQRQRVAIARALASDPLLIVADEAVASLDVSARGQILNLLGDLQAEHGFACVHVSHDLSLVRHLCQRVVVMYAGRVVETAPVEELFAEPRHPYTRALIDAVPTIDGLSGQASVKKDRVEPRDTGCPYHGSCPWARDICRTEDPPSVEIAASHVSRCHFARDLGEAASVPAELQAADPSASH